MAVNGGWLMADDKLWTTQCSREEINDVLSWRQSIFNILGREHI